MTKKAAADESKTGLYEAIYASNRRPPPRQPSDPGEATGRSPSLLTDTLSSSRHRSRFPIPMWAVGAAVFVLVVFVIIVAGPARDQVQPIIPTPVRLPPETVPAAVTPESAVAPVAVPPEPTPTRSAQPPPTATVPPPPDPTPPPPPRPRAELSGPRPQLVRGAEGASGPAETAETSQPPPQAAAPGRETSPPENEAAPVANEIDPQAVAAFELLQNKSDPALKLAGDLFEGFTFLQWQVAGRRGDAYLIDIVAKTAQGNELHYVWAVDPAQATVRALSQAARDLESRGGPQDR